MEEQVIGWDLEEVFGIPLQSEPCCWPEQVERGWYPDHTPDKVVLGDSGGRE